VRVFCFVLGGGGGDSFSCEWKKRETDEDVVEKTDRRRGRGDGEIELE
jgi:hypothetical protein